MDESFANFVDEAENSQNSNRIPDHGWQKVVYPKRHKRNGKNDDAGGRDLRPNGIPSNVFRSVDLEGEERRRRIESQQKKEADAEKAQLRVRSGGSEEEDSEGDENSGEVVNVAKEVKPKQKKVKKPKITVGEAAGKINAEDLYAALIDITGSFENMPDIQLKRFADCLAKPFSAVSASQFPWTKMFKESLVEKIVEIPCCYISEDVYKVCVDWLAQKPAEALGDFAFWALDIIVDDLAAHLAVAKGSKKPVQQSSSKAQVGIFLVLALVLRRKSEVLLNFVQKLKTDPKYQGQEKLPLIVWVVAQACQGDLAVGMSLWVQVLLPWASGKSSNPYTRDLALQLLERILSAPKARPVLINGAIRKGERLVPPAALELLMQATFPVSSARVKATERFEALYPFLKELALAGSPGSKAMKQVVYQLFPAMVSLVNKSNPELSREATDISVWCLAQNPECYKQWEKLYLGQLDASLAILRKLSEDWKEQSSRLSPLDHLKQTIRNLHSQNEQALNEGETNEVQLSSIKVADKLCKTLTSKFSRRGSCLRAGFAVITVGAFVVALGSYMDEWDFKKVVAFIGTQ